MESLPLISVIVPVYNVEKYLQKCIDSILNQTYENLEIFLVDDGSTDHSGKICDKYALEDNRIIVIHKNNGGLSDARNVAIDVMTGKYVTFVDSDDFIEKEYLSYLYYLIDKYNAEISICNFKYINENGGLINKVKNTGDEKRLSSKEAIDSILDGREINTSASMKLYKSLLFDSIRYPKGKLYEDISTTYKLFFNADRLVFGEQSLYVYLCRRGSITKQSFNENKLDAIKNMEVMCNDISKKYPELKKKSLARLFSQLVTIYVALKTSQYNDKLEKELYERIRAIDNIEFCNFKQIVYYTMARCGKSTFDICVKIEDRIQNARKNSKG